MGETAQQNDKRQVRNPAKRERLGGLFGLLLILTPLLTLAARQPFVAQPVEQAAMQTPRPPRSEQKLLFLPLISSSASTLLPTPTATPSRTPVPSPTPTATVPLVGFTNCASRSGNNATIAVPAAVSVVGTFIWTPGDQLAVFTPGGLCAGVVTWTGSNVAITAWGDNSQTTSVDGLRPGEEMSYRIWDASRDRILSVSAVTYSLGDGVYAVDSLHAIHSLAVGGSLAGENALSEQPRGGCGRGIIALPCRLGALAGEFRLLWPADPG